MIRTRTTSAFSGPMAHPTHVSRRSLFLATGAVVAGCAPIDLTTTGTTVTTPISNRLTRDDGPPMPQPRPPEASPRPVRAVLFRGLFELFSLGMDDLRGKIRAQGHQAHTYSVSQTDAVIATMLSRHRARPNGEHLVLIGHSWGGDSALRIADALAPEDGRVALIIGFDMVTRRRVGPNVERVVNYYQSGGGWSGPVRVADGSPALVENRDLGLALNRNHLNLERNSELHDDILARISRLTA